MWSPDGTELFYDARGQFTSVKVSPVPLGAAFASGTPVPMDIGVGVYDFGFLGRPYDISPDGRRFLFSRPYVTRRPAASRPRHYTLARRPRGGTKGEVIPTDN